MYGKLIRRCEICYKLFLVKGDLLSTVDYCCLTVSHYFHMIDIRIYICTMKQQLNYKGLPREYLLHM